MKTIHSLAVMALGVALTACAPPEVNVPPPTDAGAAPSGGGGGGGDAAPVGNASAGGDASASSQGLVDGPGDRGGLGKEDVVNIKAEMLCADKRTAGDDAARAQAHAEIIAQHGTQQKWLDQVSKDITEEPELEKQLNEKIAAKAAEICPEGGAAPADAAPADAPSDAPPAEAPADAPAAEEKAAGEKAAEEKAAE